VKVKVKQVRGSSNSGDRVNRTLKALGLGRVGKSKSFDLSNNDALKGMIKSVGHLVEVVKA
jgi:ribosomal protein L30